MVGRCPKACGSSNEDLLRYAADSKNFLLRPHATFIYFISANLQVWRLSDHELISSFRADLQQTRPTAAVAAAALFRGHQSAVVVAASNPGISELALLPTIPGAGLRLERLTPSATAKTSQIPLTGESADERLRTGATALACRLISSAADGGLRLRCLVPRPKPFMLSS
ncbi:unnamed protein product [Protopolystoma xenopodis]|uniref:Uncharacterized protein n=1 Tax=Protopolystoma xenopodis TaxID=117903 RepID=A0A3S4ZXQ8_9PLAT|nr:unnamed protein product [Protopolystoma xenopodis]